MDLSQLLFSFPDIVFLLENNGYRKSAGSYFVAFENEVLPVSAIQPKTAEQLGQPLKHLAANTNVETAVRSYGHPP